MERRNCFSLVTCADLMNGRRRWSSAKGEHDESCACIICIQDDLYICDAHGHLLSISAEHLKFHHVKCVIIRAHRIRVRIRSYGRREARRVETTFGGDNGSQRGWGWARPNQKPICRTTLDLSWRWSGCGGSGKGSAEIRSL
jgi:hypothetical protein